MSFLFHWLIGIAYADSASSSVGTLPTGQLSTASDLANRILGILSYFAYPLAFTGIVYIAYLLITAGASPDGWTKAKKYITYILIGFFLIFGAGLFVNILRSILLTK